MSGASDDLQNPSKGATDLGRSRDAPWSQNDEGGALARPRAPGTLLTRLTGGVTLLPFLLPLRRRVEDTDPPVGDIPGAGVPIVEPQAGAPIGLPDLQHLEHLAGQVSSRSVAAESYLEAKIALLARPTTEALVGPVARLPFPSDELLTLERLHLSGALSSSEYEVLRRRVLLRI